MKIMYLICTHLVSNGIGGHFHSLKSTVEALNENVQCIVVNIGRIESPVINTLKSRVYNINYTYYNPITIALKLIKIVKSEQPDVLHAYDINSLFYAAIISHYCKKPYISTLCGGPNPVFFPKIKDLILFSNENKKYFEQDPNYNNLNIHLIPNRIQRPTQDYNKIHDIKRKLDPKAYTFLRIARISSFHINSLLQSIALIDALNKENLRSQLVIVGSIQESDAYEEIVRKKGENTIIITDERYTTTASEIIDVSEVVIGTGRGFMEGASMGKILLCPSNASRYPILATKDNFHNLFDNNFSMRSFDESSTDSSNLDAIVQLLKKGEQKEELANYMYQMSREYFETEMAIKKYLIIYQELKCDPRIDIHDLIVHLGIVIHANSPLLRLLLRPIRGYIEQSISQRDCKHSYGKFDND